jgi:adenine phosphoribosyltransferase
MADLLAHTLIRDVPDFPKPGIIFKDLCPVIADPAAFQEIIDLLSSWGRASSPDVVVGIESRGFIFGAPAGLALGASFVPARKGGKLPGDVVGCSYDLEYGTAVIEIQRDAILPGQRVVVIDDVLATGGTASATGRLIQDLGGQVVGMAFVVELGFLKGRDRLDGFEVVSLLRY